MNYALLVSGINAIQYIDHAMPVPYLKPSFVPAFLKRLALRLIGR